MLRHHSYRGVVFADEDEPTAPRLNTTEAARWAAYWRRRADCVVLWFPPTSRDVTLELARLGEWSGSGRIVLGVADDAVTGANELRRWAGARRVPVARSLSATVDHAVESLPAPARREGSERDIPLLVWNTHTYQERYGSHRRAGNELVEVRWVWTFRVGPGRRRVTIWALNRKPRVAVLSPALYVIERAEAPFHGVWLAYLELISEAGLIPFVIPPIPPQADELLDVADGVFAAGARPATADADLAPLVHDVDPDSHDWDQIRPTVTRPSRAVDPLHRLILRSAVERQIPTFCVGIGTEELVVSLGGFARRGGYQPGPLGASTVSTPVTAVAGTFVADAGLTRMRCNHPGVIRRPLPGGLAVEAFAWDDTVEAIWHPTKPIWGCHGHPHEVGLAGLGEPWASACRERAALTSEG